MNVAGFLEPCISAALSDGLAAEAGGAYADVAGRSTIGWSRKKGVGATRMFFEMAGGH